MLDGEQQVEEGRCGGGDQDEDDEETRVHARSGDASLTSVSAELCGTLPPVLCEASINFNLRHTGVSCGQFHFPSASNLESRTSKHSLCVEKIYLHYILTG